ncbi:MAG: hypothetical protein ACI4R9_05870 [Kiritimatiellia bacterium]
MFTSKFTDVCLKVHGCLLQGAMIHSSSLAEGGSNRPLPGNGRARQIGREKKMVGMFSPRLAKMKLEFFGRMLFGNQAALVVRRHGKWRGLGCAREERGDLQMELECLTG